MGNIDGPRIFWVLRQCWNINIAKLRPEFISDGSHSSEVINSYEQHLEHTFSLVQRFNAQIPHEIIVEMPGEQAPKWFKDYSWWMIGWPPHSRDYILTIRQAGNFCERKLLRDCTLHRCSAKLWLAVFCPTDFGESPPVIGSAFYIISPCLELPTVVGSGSKHCFGRLRSEQTAYGVPTEGNDFSCLARPWGCCTDLS